MTEQDAPPPAPEEQPEAPTATGAARPCESLAELRDAHLKLRESLGSPAERRSIDRANQIRALLKTGSETGAFLSDLKERRAAQAILDYWSAELASAAGPENFGAGLLQPADPSRVPRGDGPAPVDRSEQRALIRFSAQARRWRDSGRRSSDLIRDSITLQEASVVASKDPVLAEWVKESRRAQKARRRLWLSVASAVGLTVVCIALGIWYWHEKYLPATRNDYVAELRTISEALASLGPVKDLNAEQKKRMLQHGARQTEMLSWFVRYQGWMEPPDFARIKWRGIKLEQAKLSNPNFVDGEFKGVTLRGVNLPGAVFAHGSFAFDGTAATDGNDFSRSVLQYAQFRDARIAFTSFTEVDLYRAIFDRAELCQVSFLGANLRQASFWGAKMDEATASQLGVNAWWQVVGLPWSQIKEFAKVKHSATDEARLKASDGFKADTAPPTDDFTRSSPGSRERGEALGSIAWVRAIWGIDVKGEPAQISAEERDRGSCDAAAIPPNAVQAADKAVCIVDKLNKAQPVGQFANVLANLRDTQAYVYMQNSNFFGALDIYRQIDDEEKIAAGKSDFFQDAGTLFRYSIAQYAVGEEKNDDNAKKSALEKFKVAMIKNYQPTHELRTIPKDYFFLNKEFEPYLAALNGRLWPGERQQPSCPDVGPATAQ